MTEDHITSFEAGTITNGLMRLRREPDFSAITRLLNARKDQKKDPNILIQAITTEFVKLLKQDGGL